jgi:hypothetical protein
VGQPERNEPLSDFVKLALSWFVHLPLVSKLLLFFGCLLMLSGLFGFQPPRPILSFRLICLGLCWNYFKFQPIWFHKDPYSDGTSKRKLQVEYSRLFGGMFFLALALVPSTCLLWLYHRLSS